MNTMAGACLRACSKRSRTRAAPTPTNISTNSDPEIEKKATPASPATARARSVLPVPGGPTSSTPLGTCATRPTSAQALRRSSQSPPKPPNRSGRNIGMSPDCMIAATFSGGRRRSFSACSTWGATAAEMPRARSITSTRLIRRLPIVEIIVVSPRDATPPTRLHRTGRGGEDRCGAPTAVASSGITPPREGTVAALYPVGDPVINARLLRPQSFMRAYVKGDLTLAIHTVFADSEIVEPYKRCLVQRADVHVALDVHR